MIKFVNILLNIFNVQIDLICQDNGRGDGVKINPHIGYNCHDTIMRELLSATYLLSYCKLIDWELIGCGGGGNGGGTGGGGGGGQ